MTYHAPTTLSEALDRRREGASVIAGGTDWYPALGDAPPPPAMLDVTRLPGLRDIEAGPDGWRIGAAARWTDIIRADLPPAFDGLKAAAREVGSVQIQNAGTIAGNLCNASPAADGAPPLLALDAAVALTSPAGVRTQPLADFITGPRRTTLAADELMTAILIPPQAPSTRSAFLKLGARTHLVISIVMVSVAASLEGGRVAGARVAVGAAAPTARRLPAVEAALNGRDPADPAPMVGAGDLTPLSPIDDIRADAGYRLDAVAALCRRAMDQVLEGLR